MEMWRLFCEEWTESLNIYTYVKLKSSEYDTDHFLPYPLQFIIHNNPTTVCYKTPANEKLLLNNP
jgi:hypothetical protein